MCANCANFYIQFANLIFNVIVLMSGVIVLITLIKNILR